MESPHRRRDVVYRGLRRGSAIGAFTGGLLPACGALLTGDWVDIPVGFGLAMFSCPIGAVAGLLIALGPALVLANNKQYFLRRPVAARLCVISVMLTLTLGFTAFVVGATIVSDRMNVWNFAELAAFVVAPLGGGMALAAASTDYVLTGRKWRRDGGAAPSTVMA